MSTLSISGIEPASLRAHEVECPISLVEILRSAWSRYLDQVHINLGTFKLSYVSPENHKIGKMGWWKLGRKSGVWRPKTGFQNFSLNENGSFEYEL